MSDRRVLHTYPTLHLLPGGSTLGPTASAHATNPNCTRLFQDSTFKEPLVRTGHRKRTYLEVSWAAVARSPLAPFWAPIVAP